MAGLGSGVGDTGRDGWGMDDLGSVMEPGNQKCLAGKIGEEIAVLFLRLKGYRILERNVRTRRSEVDVVACKDGALVFVEVKLRGPDHLSEPAESVGRVKRQRISRGALALSQRYAGGPFDTFRFDVLALAWRGTRLTVDHIENAFELEGVSGW
ncbi:MAG: YraN family protein [Candidatus Eisenbacteria bacterium]